jgi:hypothetical protein
MDGADVADDDDEGDPARGLHPVAQGDVVKERVDGDDDIRWILAEKPGDALAHPRPEQSKPAAGLDEG